MGFFNIGDHLIKEQISSFRRHCFPPGKKKQQPLLRSSQRLGIHDKALMDALSRRTMQCGFLLMFKAQGVANTAWAYATLGIHNKPLMDAFVKRKKQAH